MRRLVIRPGGIGDCLLCFPALEELRPAEVWCPSPVVPLVHFAPAFSIASTGLDSVGIPCVAPPASVVERLRGFDEIVSWYGANRESFQEAAFRLGLNIRFRPALPPPDSALHAIDFFLGRASGERPHLPFSAKREGFVAIHPFSGGAKKNWPLERFRALALPEVRFTAGPEERLADAIRFERLDELAAWLASASLYIGNDSGITHLAAAVGTPTVALFGATDPKIWAPRGDHVRIVKADTLEEITIEDVLAAGRDLGSRRAR